MPPSDDDPLDEYVLNDVLTVSTGTAHMPLTQHWCGAQFDEDVLDNVCTLLTRAQLPARHSTSAYHVVQAVTQMVL
jgi:hypothetical protein